MARRAKIFWTGRSQAVRLPREFRFEGDEVVVRREGRGVLLEPVDAWPEDYVESFAGFPADFERPPQGTLDRRHRFR